jgi:shikimate dehydrogenase
MIHNHWINAHNLDAIYSRIPVEPGQLSQFISQLPEHGLCGCNVTIPHKEGVYKLVKIADESTHRLTAVNTVFCRNGEYFGTNTDGEGFLGSLSTQITLNELRGGTAVILGAGGAAASVADALMKQGMSQITVVNRSLDRAYQLSQRFGGVLSVQPWDKRSAILRTCDLLVNTTSLGMIGQPQLDIELDYLPTATVVTDIVYTPLRTNLLIAASRHGNRVVEGLGMLLHQAVRGFELWFGIRPTVTKELHDMVARDIDPGFKP